MFSASSANTPVGTVRTSRRRARPASNEGSGPKAKRQRSTMTEHTFVAPDGPVEMEETKPNLLKLSPTLARRESPPIATIPTRDIAVRGKKQRSGERLMKEDGSVNLTKNDTYTVSKLPALPDFLRRDAMSRQHGAIYSDSGYALALTHTHAIVWPYTAHEASPESFSFALPEASKNTFDPLPLGSLVSASASSEEPGLVVIIPNTGKITYWESIASAATLNLRLQRNGVEEKIAGMMSGEKVVQILNAESAGFMLAFSTGRIAFMTVRDGNGKPKISVQFLRSGNGSANTGIFGSLRNVLSSSSWHGEISAIRAGPSDRTGERNVVLATKKGKIQSWDIHRSGHTSMLAESDSREPIVLAIKQAIPSLNHLLIEKFELLDIAYKPEKPESNSSTAVVRRDKNGGQPLLLLTSLTDRNVSHYSLVDVVLSPTELIIGSIRPIKSYATPVDRTTTSNTRLYLPDPNLAFVVFNLAVVVVSLAKQEESPDSQLMAENHLYPHTFEDVVDFSGDLNIEIVGSGMENPTALQSTSGDHKTRRYKIKQPSTVLLVRGGGVIRVAANDVSKLRSAETAPQVTAKTKLTQAVFYGTLSENPINFAVRPESEFPPREVAEAALELSADILRSEISNIPSLTASVEQNLRLRSAALHELACYLQSSGVELDRVTRWRLLWDAEKMAAAMIVWKKYDECVSEKPAGQKRGLLTEVVEFIHEDYKSNPVTEAGELDRVRFWFLKDIWRLDIALPWAYQVMKYTFQDGEKGHDVVMEVLSEANDLVIGALQGAFDFRTENVSLYGLETEPLEHGILTSDYEDLPEFWTSTQYLVENLRKQPRLAAVLLKEYWDKGDQREGQPSAAVLSKVRKEQHTLIDMAIRSNYERIRWASVQQDQQVKLQAGLLQVAQSELEEEIKELSNALELPDEAMHLAEQHQMLPTLASVLFYELKEGVSNLDDPNFDPELRPNVQRRNNMLQNTVSHCFERFGMRWASAYYELVIQTNSMKDLLDGFPEKSPYLTQFLREKPEYAKIGWIQEVTREKDFDKASQTLLNLGLHREQDAWSKKIELSIGKLARLSCKSYSEDHGIIIPDGGKMELRSTHDQLALIKIQEIIYDHVHMTITNAIDQLGEVQLAMETYGNQKQLNNSSHFYTLLSENMNTLVEHRAMTGLELVDLLSLMGDNGPEDTLRDQQFYLALKAIRHGVPDKGDSILMQRVVWRRCMLRDDWAALNDTEGMNDAEAAERLERTALYLTFRACLKDDLLSKDSVIKPVNPEAILGAATDELDHRFDRLDSGVRDTFFRDYQQEDSAFEYHITHHRLEKWHQVIFDQAQRDYKEELANETSHGVAHMRALLQAAEKRISDKEAAEAEKAVSSRKVLKRAVNGHGNANGNGNGVLGHGRSFRSSVKQY
ncbi:hypothetical protein HYFRA_00010646 [Hymenoscyphus fraxineus]|uniref:Uncharacterized protein n=1 Tax=Hymenoscyphus fraxineus TaxID=746836 RepID=A0A9N9L9T9_9HELO|nr:hypothetical protein HYFRA_00010646 [Hymenoscyphus fraxineus]